MLDFTLDSYKISEKIIIKGILRVNTKMILFGFWMMIRLDFRVAAVWNTDLERPLASYLTSYAILIFLNETKIANSPSGTFLMQVDDNWLKRFLDFVNMSVRWLRWDYPQLIQAWSKISQLNGFCVSNSFVMNIFRGGMGICSFTKILFSLHFQVKYNWTQHLFIDW